MMLLSPPAKAIAAGNHMTEVELGASTAASATLPSIDLTSCGTAEALIALGSPYMSPMVAPSPNEIVDDVMYPEGNRTGPSSTSATPPLPSMPQGSRMTFRRRPPERHFGRVASASTKGLRVGSPAHAGRHLAACRMSAGSHSHVG
ncbi:hypothetical protein CH35J_012894 [Colletotrichum higginsianum]|uniref:Uncharacterized protein n=1 Tax=Colletotrichum higginsianum TaxID=80884 RepID=A0A4T0VCH2_9PEZI|nr:hypothetical protein CH35J_012894 [Colletotrichum higginsianum]